MARFEYTSDLIDTRELGARLADALAWPGVRCVPDRLEPALSAASMDHDIKRYPNARHGFLNDHDPAELPIWVKAIAKLGNASYDEPTSRATSRDARRRIIVFLRAHLSGGG